MNIAAEVNKLTVAGMHMYSIRVDICDRFDGSASKEKETLRNHACTFTKNLSQTIKKLSTFSGSKVIVIIIITITYRDAQNIYI